MDLGYSSSFRGPKGRALKLHIVCSLLEFFIMDKNGLKRSEKNIVIKCFDFHKVKISLN